MPSRIVTLTTDFGTADHYAGTMKGVILNVNPNAQVIDICNSVQSYDLLDGALTIAQSYRYFPSGTVHVVVVDPGVGSTRRPLLVTTERHYFVAPDNGVLSLVYDREERLVVRHVTAEHYFLQPISRTFHGRDIFAAVAGWLSKGVEPAKFGDTVPDFVRFAAPRAKMDGPQQVRGLILKVDKFGNLITNISEEEAPQLFAGVPVPFRMNVGKAEITTVRGSFSEGRAGEVFAIVGSMGLLEIASNRSAASHLTGAGKGAEVILRMG